MRIKQQLLAHLRETQGLYHIIAEQGQQHALQYLHDVRQQNFQHNYADYLRQKRYEPALTFILRDVYSSLAHEERDAKIAKAFSSMSRVLPDAILETITKAVGFNCSMLSFDYKLTKGFNAVDDTVCSYRELVAQRGMETLHIQLVHDFVELAETIHFFVKKPFMHMTLKASRIPAKAANLMELQEFLERCFVAFTTMRSPDVFLSDYQQRELS